MSPECGPAPVTTVPVDQHDRAREHEQAAHPLHAGRHRHDRVGRRLGRVVVEEDGVGEQHHRDEEVRHHERGRQQLVDDELAQDDLDDDAADEAEREEHEPPGPGRAHQRAEHGHDHDQRHQAGHDPVDELDHGVRVGRRLGREAPGLAVRPVGTPEARPGEPHRRAGHDDDGEQDDRDERDAPVLTGAHAAGAASGGNRKRRFARCDGTPGRYPRPGMDPTRRARRQRSGAPAACLIGLALGALVVGGVVTAGAMLRDDPSRSSLASLDRPAFSRTPDSTSPSTAPAPPSTRGVTGSGEPVTFAFGGDVHFEGSLRARLDDPSTALASIAPTLSAADVAVVNLETAITERGTPANKDVHLPRAGVVVDGAGRRRGRHRQRRPTTTASTTGSRASSTRSRPSSPPASTSSGSATTPPRRTRPTAWR